MKQNMCLLKNGTSNLMKADVNNVEVLSDFSSLVVVKKSVCLEAGFKEQGKLPAGNKD